jgi:hypothetical protein
MRQGQAKSQAPLDRLPGSQIAFIHDHESAYQCFEFRTTYFAAAVARESHQKSSKAQQCEALEAQKSMQ